MTSGDFVLVSTEAATDPPAKPTSRRRMLKLGGAGAAALVATMLPRNGARATHDGDGSNALHVGEENQASAQTVLEANITPPLEGPAEPPALRIENHTGTGIHSKGTESGLFGESDEFRGVYGKSDTGVGVRAESLSGAGLEAHSNTSFGVVGGSDGSLNEGGVGVGGFSAADLAVLGIGGSPGDSAAEGDGVGGFSFNSIGGRFVSFNGIGARAVSPGDVHPALQAASGNPTDPHQAAVPDQGLALEVIGKARFSTAGKAPDPRLRVRRPA